MKNALLTLLTAGLLVACGRSENAKDSTARSAPDSVAVPAAKPRNCQSVVDADQLGKPLEYRETAKPIIVTITLNPDTSAVETAGGCFTNNTTTVKAVRTSGKFLFNRTLTKDDLLLFVPDGAARRQSILQRVTYKPTFNGEKYFNLTMRLVEPVSKKTTDYTAFVNYYGEIVKVK